jgi:hypothetical protein
MVVVRECLEVEKHEVEFAYGRRLQWLRGGLCSTTRLGWLR